jgi:hypothetical protein
MGALLGAGWRRRDDGSVDPELGVKEELGRAWGEFIREKSDVLTSRDWVQTDWMQAQGHPPPGYTWHTQIVRESGKNAVSRPVLLPPGYVMRFDGRPTMIYDPQVVVVEDEIDEFIASVSGGGPLSRTSRGSVYRIMMHGRPDPFDASIRPFRFHYASPDIGSSVNLSMLPLAIDGGAALQLTPIFDGESYDRSPHLEALWSALKSGYLLAVRLDRNEVLLLHPIPSVFDRGMDPLQLGNRRRAISNRWEMDERGRNMLRLGYGLPIEEPIRMAPHMRLEDELHPIRFEDEETRTVWETGKTRWFNYQKNLEPSPDMGTMFAQHIEPAGNYVNEAAPDAHKYALPNYDYGTMVFESPLVIPSVFPVDGRYAGPEGWKARLSRAFDGKTGMELSLAVLDAGYDGIVTIDLSGSRGPFVSEIVSLKDVRSRAARARELLQRE